MVAWHFNFKENSTTTKQEGVVSRIVVTSTVSWRRRLFPWCLHKGVNKTKWEYQTPRGGGKKEKLYIYFFILMIELDMDNLGKFLSTCNKMVILVNFWWIWWEEKKRRISIYKWLFFFLFPSFSFYHEIYLFVSLSLNWYPCSNNRAGIE